ncbi:MAG: hypothetical protein FD130_2369 [Halothiobacillaceae bacterium]|nr:MAG: hypothetical protein FD130_2369 [Halothiobacillaceae bacterium]
MQKTLADSGPLIAAFDRDDKHHSQVISFIKSYKGTIFTSWPVLTEVCHLLGDGVEGRLAFLSWIHRGGLTVVDLAPHSLQQIIDLTTKYRDRPMDLADASLVVLALQTGVKNIISLDSDFHIYRLPDRGILKNLLL